MSADALTQLHRTPLVLEGTNVRLEPLTLDHAADLFAVAQHDEVWSWLTFPRPADLQDMRAYVAYRLGAQARNHELPFAVIERAGCRAIGGTRYHEIDPAHRQLEIGGTWYGRAYWRTAVNTECKYLLLRHAFESLGCVRVQFTAHLRNQRSQRALERIGATREGHAT